MHYTIISHIRELLILNGMPYQDACRLSEEVNDVLENADTVSTLNGTTFTKTFYPSVADPTVSCGITGNVVYNRRPVGEWTTTSHHTVSPFSSRP